MSESPVHPADASRWLRRWEARKEDSMSRPVWRWRDYARLALGGIRLFNGTVALLAPGWLVRRVGLDPDTNPIASYVFRMFGIRTVLLGVVLLRGERGGQARVLRAD